MSQAKKYNFKELQKKWDKEWQAQKIYQPNLETAKNPFYALYMFPYPSAEGLHVGHAFSGTGADVYARFKRMKGMDVFQPMGFDAFGIHSENFALKIGDHPQNLIDRATKHFRDQFDSLGFSYDWDHSVNTSSPDYYKWTQWLFIQLFKAGLAEKKKAEVNWCPSCKTVLADEQVLSGLCERCGSVVEKKELEQWFFKITDYADRLLEGLDRIDWTPKVLLAQRNWIGKSEGMLIKFRVKSEKLKVDGDEEFVEVFTTKPETVDGSTFIVLSPEHKLIQKLLDKNSQFLILNSQLDKVKEYVERAQNKSETNLEKEKTGVFSGLYAINPVTNKEIPVWISDYVLASYGTGAIMAVPIADERDREFAEKFDLPIIPTSFKAKPDGEKRTNYHLRDWLISRQRYWGAPIPMIKCDKDGWVPVDEKDLPVVLPYIENFKPLGTGVAPLAQDKDFVNTTCPKCGGPATRETDVADTFLDSSWYFLRYPSASSGQVPFEPKLTKKWLPVDSYIGGAEHSVLHLLYSRFVTKALFDQKLLDFDEPFTKFRAHGLIIKDGAKMSKSRGNVVNPDELIERYGADTLRCYLMFLGPFDQGGDFRDSGIEGMERFLKRAQKIVERSVTAQNKPVGREEYQSNKSSDNNLVNYDIEKSAAKVIKGVGNDVESLRYNTAIAKIMEFVNDLNISKTSFDQKYLKILVLVLAPFAPYLAEELWQILNPGSSSVHLEKWPVYDEAMLKEDQFTIAVQINGKLRSQFTIDNLELTNKKLIEEKAIKDPNISKYIDGKQIKKVIYVPGKILNFVIDKAISP